MTRREKNKGRAVENSRLAKDYERIVRLVHVPLPEPVYRETLEQPYPYPPVETITTYGAYVDLAEGA